MKSFVLVISFYLLFLSVVPCHCEESPAGVNIPDTELLLSGGNHQHEDSTSGFPCTSFCRCSNFHNPNFFIPEEAEPTSFALFVKNSSVYRNTYSSTLYYSFWQPPRA